MRGHPRAIMITIVLVFSMNMALETACEAPSFEQPTVVPTTVQLSEAEPTPTPTTYPDGGGGGGHYGGSVIQDRGRE